MSTTGKHFFNFPGNDVFPGFLLLGSFISVFGLYSFLSPVSLFKIFPSFLKSKFSSFQRATETETPSSNTDKQKNRGIILYFC